MTRKQFLKLPMGERRKILRKQCDSLICKTPSLTILKSEANKVIRTLDLIAVELSNHDHQWSDRLRADYETSIKIMTGKTS